MNQVSPNQRGKDKNGDGVGHRPLSSLLNSTRISITPRRKINKDISPLRPQKSKPFIQKDALGARRNGLMPLQEVPASLKMRYGY